MNEEKTEFKEGDKVRLVKTYAPCPERYKMDKIYTLILCHGHYLMVHGDDNETGDYITGTAKGYFELVKEDVPKKENDLGWGF